MKKVSIIMPIYNVEEYLDRSIGSLLNQTLKDIEIILIDDGSTDKSLEIVKHYAESNSDRIKYISVENGGAAKARNLGLSIAEGEYIGFVDSDDFVDATMFEKMYNLAKSDDAEIVTCGYNRIDYNDIQQRDIKSIACFGKNVFQAPELISNNVPYIWNKIFKHSLITETGIHFEENLRIFEDLVFTYKLFLNANRISRVCEPLYNYIFSRTNSLTYTFSEKRFDIFPAFDSLIGYYRQKGYLYHFEEELLFELMNHIYVVCGNEVQYRKMGLKYRFINEAFAYLDKQFPFWKGYTMYYRKYKKNKFLYSKKMYWRFYSLIPRPVRVFKKNISGFRRKLSWFNRRGRDFYIAYQHQKVENKRILINSQHGANLSGNMFYILKEVCTNPAYSDYDIGVTYGNEKNKKQFISMMEEYNFSHNKIIYLKNNSKEYAHFLATAGYLFNDTSFPVYFIKRKEQVYLNTWHGTPLKTLGRSTANDYFDIANLQKNFLMADYLLYPSEYMKDYMLKDYMLSPLAKNKLLMCGYPRNEIFFDKNRENALRERFNLENKQVIAYMPTWRGNVRDVRTGQSNEISLYLDELDQKLRDDQILYVNLHPYMAKSIKYDYYKHIYEFPAELETYDFLNCCDVLITDYSSVFFDFAVSKKKIVLFAYDEEKYFKDRGVYMPFSQLPFPKVRTIDELLSELDKDYILDEGISKFLDTYCFYEDAEISKKICNTVILNKDSNLKTIQMKDEQDNTILLFANNFKDQGTVERLDELCNASKQMKKKLYFTYETKNISNTQFLKHLSRKYDFMGTLNAFSTNPLLDCIFVTLSLNHKVWQKLFKGRIKKVMLREWKRAYPDVSFQSVVLFGHNSARDIIFASYAEKNKFIYIEKAEDWNPNVDNYIYERFDHIIFVNKSVQKECGYKGYNANIRKLQSFNDLFIRFFNSSYR